MTTALPTSVNSTNAGFASAFKHGGTTERHADSLACIAIIASTTLADVFEKAEQLGLPKAGPYNHMLDSDFLAKVLTGLPNINWLPLSGSTVPTHHNCQAAA